MNNNENNTNIQNPQINQNNMNAQANQNNINTQTTANSTNVQQPVVATNNTSTSNQPVVQNNVNIQPTQPEQTNNIQESKVPDMFDDDDDTPSGDATDITFDYNEIYGVKETENNDDTSIDNNLPVFDEKEIVIDEDKLKKDTNDVVPEFRIDELEGNSNSTNKSIDSLVDDKDADKADTKRKIAYILAIALILIVFVWFIFPIMAGYRF